MVSLLNKVGMKKHQAKSSGFTLIELIVTIAIAAILIGVAVPSFMELIRDNQTATQSTRFIADLNLARSEAVKRGINVFVCKSSDQATCTNGSNWESGWLVIADADRDAGFDAGPILHVNQGLDTNFTLRPAVGNFSNWIRYDSNGAASGDGAGNDETFRLCRPDSDAAQSRRIDIVATGRVNLTEGTTACP